MQTKYFANESLVKAYPLPLMGLRGLYVIRQNVEALLQKRSLTQTDLAQYLHKDKSWINKFLKGTRQIQLKDLDRIADILGVATYQLFQPGISRSAERRVIERRRRTERRVNHAERMGANNVPSPSERVPVSLPELEPLARALQETLHQLSVIAGAAEGNDRQAASPRPRKAAARRVAD